MCLPPDNLIPTIGAERTGASGVRARWERMESLQGKEGSWSERCVCDEGRAKE